MHRAAGVSVRSPWSTRCGAASLPSPIPPLQGLAPGGDKEPGYFLGVGRFLGLGLFMQVLAGRSLSSFKRRVAAGTNQPLVWGRVGDDLSHRPFRWDVLLLCKHVRNQLCVGVFPVPYQEHSSPPSQLCMPPAVLYFIVQPLRSWIPVMHSQMRDSLRPISKLTYFREVSPGTACCMW